MPEFYYRITNQLVSAGVDERDNPLGPPLVHVYVHAFPVISRTPKGTWIDYYGARRFVLTTARRQFACPTLDLAKASFIARKNRQVRILKAQIHTVERALADLDMAIGMFRRSNNAN